MFDPSSLSCLWTSEPCLPLGRIKFACGCDFHLLPTDSARIHFWSFPDCRLFAVRIIAPENVSNPRGSTCLSNFTLFLPLFTQLMLETDLRGDMVDV
jgi:hypothetical protein